MLLTEPGNISDHLDLLGDAASPFYLLRGRDRYALVDAAIAAMIPKLIDQLKAYQEVSSRMSYFLVTHSHFDHVGGLSALRRIFPSAEVLASFAARDIFSRPGPMNYIRTMNDAMVKLGGVDTGELDLSVEDSIPVDRVLKEGDTIDLGGGVSVEVYEVPGHSRCSLAYFLQPDQAVFSGESFGYFNGKGKVLPEGLSSFKSYLESLKKLSRLGAEYICLPHNGVLTGKDAEGYFHLAYESGVRFRTEVLEFFRQGMQDEDIIQHYIQRDYQGLIKLQPEAVFRQNLAAQLRAIRRELESELLE